jgi:hypothetical protein
MTANPYRGEVTVELGGESFAARPTYAAILAWEEKTGRTSTELLMRMTSGVFGVRDLVAILQPALEAGGTRMKEADLGERIVRHGQADVLKPVALILRNALTGGKEDELGEVKPGLELVASSTGA